MSAWATVCRDPGSSYACFATIPALANARSAVILTGMKTAVCVPDDLFAQVDRLASRSRRSRSEVYSAALREYVARHAPDEVMARLDAVVAEVGDPGVDAFVGRASRHVIGSSEW